MVANMKKFLGKILPVPAKTFHAMMIELREKQERDYRRLVEMIRQSVIEVNKTVVLNSTVLQEAIHNNIEEANNKTVQNINELKKNILNIIEEINDTTIQNTNELKSNIYQSFDEFNKKNDERTSIIQRALNEKDESEGVALEAIIKTANEILWACIFNSSTTNSEWLINKTFSPGRWAVGYPFFYFMYKTLDVMKPKCILEIGLGQSTNMITQYVAAHDDVKHIVVEQDLNFIDFHLRFNQICCNTKIVHIPVKEIQFQDDLHTLVYDGFIEYVGVYKYDVIFIDGPGHSKSSKYRRIDVIELIKNNMQENFCIMFDDTDINTCKNSLQMIFDELTNNNLKYHFNHHHGKRSCTVITSEKLKYLTTM